MNATICIISPARDSVKCIHKYFVTKKFPTQNENPIETEQEIKKKQTSNDTRFTRERMRFKKKKNTESNIFTTFLTITKMKSEKELMQQLQSALEFGVHILCAMGKSNNNRKKKITSKTERRAQKWKRAAKLV